MRRLLPLLTLSIVLASCATNNTTTLERENANPLTAQQYGEELADTLANLIIQKDSITKDAATVERIQSSIQDAKSIADAAQERMQQGMAGALLRVKAVVEGYALYLHDTLYFSPDFYTKPGPDLHVYLSKAVDPRDGTFPDASAIDLGPLQRIEGAQEYAVPSQKNPKEFLSVALWDRSLGLLYGFAQIR